MGDIIWWQVIATDVEGGVLRPGLATLIEVMISVTAQIIIQGFRIWGGCNMFRVRMNVWPEPV